MEKNINACELIQEIKKKGVSKYKIAKKMGVSWNTVHMWEKGLFCPAGDKKERLLEFLGGLKQ